MTFSEFLLTEMPLMVRQPVDMDEDDISFLQQFPKRFWTAALKQRYNDLLLRALDQGGQIRPDWDDVQDLTVSGHTFKDVNTYMRPLADKMRRSGHDLRGGDPTSGTLAGVNLMKTPQAAAHMANWIKDSGGRTHPEREFSASDSKGREKRYTWANPALEPGFARFTPNKIDRSEYSHEAGSDEDREAWYRLKPKVEEMAVQAVNSALQTISNVQNPYHGNFKYWNDRRDQLIDATVLHARKNIANPRMADGKFLGQVVRDFVWTRLRQEGDFTRRMFQAAARQGIDIGELLSQGHSADSIRKMIGFRPPGRPGAERPEYRSVKHDKVADRRAKAAGARLGAGEPTEPYVARTQEPEPMPAYMPPKKKVRTYREAPPLPASAELDQMPTALDIWKNYDALKVKYGQAAVWRKYSELSRQEKQARRKAI